MANSSLLGTYSPEDVTVVLSNAQFTHTASGFADGSFLTITRVIPAATLYTGADASSARVLRRVKNLDITFMLHQSSETNDVLSQLQILDEQAHNNDNLFSITIKDNMGRSVYSSDNCFIGTTPDGEFGTDLSTRSWILHSVGSEVFHGGNAKFNPDTATTVQDLGYTPNQYWTT